MGITPATTPSLQSVPFLDLKPAHAPLRETILEQFAVLIATGAFANGPQVGEFEEAFASYVGTEHCVGVASGLDGLRLALQAAGIERGDEVIVPANTFIATAEAVTQAGGTPVLVDVTEFDYNLDVDAVAAAITSRTRFLLPVHLYGQLADMRALIEIVERHDVTIIEDACQAHGATRDGLTAGATGAGGAFSFYPGKNLGAFGDAGAVTTSSGELAAKLRALREHGQTSKYHHDLVGWTSRLDTIQAIALSAKLPHLNRWNEERRSAARYYLERLDALGDLLLPPIAPTSEPVWHLFVIQTENPAQLGDHLRHRGVATGRHYPQPIHLTNAYADLGQRAGAFPAAEKLARRCLSLPIYPGITESQLATVCDSLESFFARG